MAKMKPESEETLEDELKETPEQQAKEQKEGTEEHDFSKIDASKGDMDAETGDVDIPEDFQREVSATLAKHGKNKSRLEYIRNKIYQLEEELRKLEVKKTPKEFSTESMPSTD